MKLLTTFIKQVFLTSFFILPFSSIAFSKTLSTSSTPLTVYIDPGHGGLQDHGAQNAHSTIKESHINLKVAQFLFKKLKKDSRFHAHLIRTSDTFLPVVDRVPPLTASHLKRTVFLSLHGNFSYSPKAQGAEFYIDTPLPTFYFSSVLTPPVNEIVHQLRRQQKLKHSLLLAQHLIRHWKTKKRKPSLRQAPFFVLSQNPSPSVLVEMGYLSHKKEALKLNSSPYQKKLASFLYEGLKTYRQALDKL